MYALCLHQAKLTTLIESWLTSKTNLIFFSFFISQMYVYDQENFQGRMIEISNECMNVCEMGMDRVRSLRVECGP